LLSLYLSFYRCLCVSLYLPLAFSLSYSPPPSQYSFHSNIFFLSRYNLRSVSFSLSLSLSIELGLGLKEALAR
jgi:hypothetical protein